MAKIGKKKVSILGEEYEFIIHSNTQGVFYTMPIPALKKYDEIVGIHHNLENSKFETIALLYNAIDEYTNLINTANTTTERVIIVKAQRRRNGQFEQGQQIVFAFLPVEKVKVGNQTTYYLMTEEIVTNKLKKVHNILPIGRKYGQDELYIGSELEIPLTDENYAFLKAMEKAMRELGDKMEAFFKTKDSILNMISSNTKLLGE